MNISFIFIKIILKIIRDIININLFFIFILIYLVFLIIYHPIYKYIFYKFIYYNLIIFSLHPHTKIYITGYFYTLLFIYQIKFI